MFGAFFGTFPVVGATYRSALSADFGAKTQVFTIISASIVTLATYFAGPACQNLPRAVLAGIVVVAASSIIDMRRMIDIIKQRV